MNSLRNLLFAIGWIASAGFVGGNFGAAAEVQLFVATPLPAAARAALTELRDAAKADGVELREAATMPEANLPAIVVGVAGKDTEFDQLLSGSKVSVGPGPESTTTAWCGGRKQTLALAGRDERGLTYALRDAARGLAVAQRGGDWTNAVTLAVESPLLKVRNVSLHLFNADCERDWFFSEDFWRDYFRRLSLSRFNRCTLTFSDQSNYLCPVYPHLFALPEYPQVTVDGLSPAERDANLAMIRRIAELADEYAIDFDLGIWMQAPVPRYSAPVTVRGLPEGLALAQYAAEALRRLYETCPSLDGIQLRMNEEAGVGAEQQTEFYRPLFQALAAVGRPLRVELRYKGLQPATIDAALDEKLDVTVSTKFWSEHFGLPYHPTFVDSHWAADRYSFGSMLKKPRKYRVTYQLWNVGSQRLTLWGDPDYAARFARSCLVGDGEGFEVFAPLTDKGYGNRPGAWPVIADPTCRVGRWEQERYWMFYLCFGRMGYNPETNPEIWRREFRRRFGEQAQSVEGAYRAASKILPLITAALLPGASEWSWWPEMDTGGALSEYSRIQTSDPGRFASVRRWERTPNWRWEDWDSRNEYTENRLAHVSDGRLGPLWFAWQLREAAAEIEALGAVDFAVKSQDAEARMTAVDLQLLQGLARYHAEKLQAAVHFARYEHTQDKSALQSSLTHLRQATQSWRALVEAVGTTYHDDLVFGVTTDSPRSKLGHHHSGHWRDRLPELEKDLESFEALAKQLGGAIESTPERQPPISLFALSQDFTHTPPLKLRPGETFTLRVQLNDPSGKMRVSVHFRPLDQTQNWMVGEMRRQGDGFEFRLSAGALDPHFDVQYFLQIDVPLSASKTATEAKSVSLLWPAPETDSPYFTPYIVVPRVTP